MKILRRAVIACAALVALVACAHDPVSVAKTPLQKAYGAMQDYQTAQEVGLAFVENPNTPPIVKDSLVRFEGAATPVFKALLKDVREVEAVRKAVLAGETPEEKLVIATAKLPESTLKLQEAMKNFERAISDAKASLKGTTGSIWEPQLVPVEPRWPVLDDDTIRRLNLQET